jgi:outer membrane protein
MKGNSIWFVGILLIVLVSLGVSAWTYYKTPRLAYINNKRLFAEFTYKKELEKELTKVEQVKKAILDSLRLNFEFKAEQLGANKKNAEQENQLRTLQQQYLLKEKQFTDNYEEASKQYTDQIWKQLNQYVKDYGQEHGYDMIFGTTNSGEIMYAEEAEDLTDDVLKFANSRYQGTLKH